MGSQNKPFAALFLLAMVAVVQNVAYWSLLPEKVATHFNIHGQPDSWMSRTAATGMMLAFQLGLPFVLLGAVSLATRLPASMVNIPNREYWLHPDRRAESLGYMRTWMAWLCVATSIEAIGINHLTFIANRQQAPLNMAWFGLILVTFLAFVALLVVKMIRRFRLP